MKEIKKDDVINLSYKDIAGLILERDDKGLNTLDLFTKIVNLLELPLNTIETNIADFYTSLTTDKRFLLVDGLWDLRVRHTSDKVLTNSLDDEDDEEIALDGEEDVEGEEEESFSDEEDIDEDTAYDDTEDDGLADLVVLGEDEIDMEN